ncbi:MAG TPA: alpha-amylase family glycosyl hydrolase [Acidobacteriaceae bacterium]|nr:alpha-amylase family glycosyl hydrolase [Acidobacteriaceae bacterium]
MEFHIARSIRNGLHIDGLLFSYTGNVIFADVAASRRLAAKLNESLGPNPDTDRIVNAGALFAMGLIDELNHALIAHYRKEVDPALWSDALRWFEQRAGSDQVEQLLHAFVEQFPNTAILSGSVTAAEWLRGATEGLPNREAALEELTLLWLSNANPAFRAFKRLFDDSSLKLTEPYRHVTAILPDYIESRPHLSPESGNLLATLQAPMLASPDSITAQLEFIREKWPEILGPDMPGIALGGLGSRILLAIDVAREEEIAIWLRFHPPGPDNYRHAAPGFGGEGFVGDEYIGFDDQLRSEFYIDAQGVRRKRVYDPEYQAPLNEYEAFSTDQSWMPNVVLIAKSTYVWLEQLSKKYGRHIYQLDHIPDEELQLLADRGVTGLWLIGLWERSIASRTIKRLRGHSDAVASAYSLKEYNIAEDLGGTLAYENLRDRARRHGLRLASDMVPNHMGIDSPWVIEHPDWFLSRPESPYPAYQFNGPDISPDPRVEIKIEDHYYDQTDAAVTFRMRQQSNGHTQFLYHGNDGTSFAWNDTAQLDYSKAYVREHVIQTILHVARQFPIIRFDAAMVLAKRHVQRLWFPLPGVGGSIPSRAEYAISQEQFDALMPHEFWREVVDRVAAEVPGTLLLAEAFWLLEGYFVRTLGMHRVYNSAFMVMLRDEENAKFRSYLKKTIEFDPDIMKRYVNFMSNPDERTAIDQFGDGDKYFGAATMLATLPGLPMFGHGQVEGFTEKYGMEYKRARMNESPNEGLVTGHMHHIAPLLKNRRIFAESQNFVLYDFWTPEGNVDENVFAYSNRLGGERSLILFNNRYGSTRGTIHVSAASMNKATGTLQQRSIAEGLALPADSSLILAFRDTGKSLEYLRRASSIQQHGLFFELHGYQYVVLLDWREMHATADEPWDTLCDQLNGRGIPSLDEALSRLRLRSLHDSLRHAIGGDQTRLFAQLSTASASLTEPMQQKPSAEVDATSAPGENETPAIAPTQLPTALPEQLHPFQQAASLFFDDLAERVQLPDCHDPIHPAASAHPAGVATSKLRRRLSPHQHFEESLAHQALAALRLPELAQHVPAQWLPIAESVLPLSASHSSALWSPLLAWIILSSIPTGRSAQAATEVSYFDQLELRAPLAETFASFGPNHHEAREDAWRAAARVRLLLWLKDDPSITTTSEAFWNDPDVRWLAGVHEYEDKTYIVHESLAALLAWLELPELLRACEGSNPQLGVRSATRALATLEAVHQAGYELNAFLKAQTAKTAPKEEEPPAEAEAIVPPPAIEATPEAEATPAPPSSLAAPVQEAKG